MESHICVLLPPTFSGYLGQHLSAFLWCCCWVPAGTFPDLQYVRTSIRRSSSSDFAFGQLVLTVASGLPLCSVHWNPSSPSHPCLPSLRCLLWWCSSAMVVMDTRPPSAAELVLPSLWSLPILSEEGTQHRLSEFPVLSAHTLWTRFLLMFCMNNCFLPWCILYFLWFCISFAIYLICYYKYMCQS